jgi:AcrR family transcriptional regulator
MNSIVPTLQSDRRARRSAEVRQRIFRCAVELFARKGFTETTVEDITNAADVGKGTFFNYFPSKDHLLSAFGEMQIGKLEAAANAARTSSVPMQSFLHSLAFRMIEEPARNPALMRIILQANLASEPVRESMRENHKRGHAYLTQIVEVGQQRNEIRKDLAAAEIAHAIRQTLLGTLLIWSVFGDASLEQRLETALRVLWNGLSPDTKMNVENCMAGPLEGNRLWIAKK